jgi:hypothetical protein
MRREDSDLDDHQPARSYERRRQPSANFLLQVEAQAPFGHFVTAGIRQAMGDELAQDAPSWLNIPFRDLIICETIGGGGVALVHRGIFRKQSVALKTLVCTVVTAVALEASQH